MMPATALDCGSQPLETARALASNAATRLRALDCYEHGAGTDPAAYYEAAGLAFEMGDSSRLVRILQRAVRVAPNFGAGHFELGNALYGLGQSREAAVAYRRALKTRQLSDMPMAYNK